MSRNWPRPESSPRVVWIMARRELRDALRSRWFALDTLAFAMLGLAVAFVSGSGSGEGLAGFGKTTAGLINLVTLIVPLMALTAGSGAIAVERERGMLPYLLSQPVSRWEVLVGKWLGLSLALSTAILLGFGVCALAVAWNGGSAQGSSALLTLAALSVVLALGVLGVGMLISVVSRRTSVATGLAVFVWLVMAFATDLGLMASTLTWRLTIQSIFVVCLVNPLQAFKLWALKAAGTPLDVLGPVGQYAADHHADSLMWLAAGSLIAWAVVPGVIGSILFSRRAAA